MSLATHGFYESGTECLWLIARTPTTDTTNPEAQTAGGKAPRKAIAVKKPKAQKGPARPYRKQETHVLQSRAATMRRKIELLKSKTVILQDRLEMHETEIVFRDETAETVD